jgi:hypothetical protein
MFRGKAEGVDFTLRFAENEVIWADSSAAKVKRETLRADEFWWDVAPGQSRPFPPPVQDHLLEIEGETQFEFGTMRVSVNKNTMQMTDLNSGTQHKILRSFELQSSLF